MCVSFKFLILNYSVKATAYFALDLSNGIISKTTEPLLDYETNPKVRVDVKLSIKIVHNFIYASYK